MTVTDVFRLNSVQQSLRDFFEGGVAQQDSAVGIDKVKAREARYVVYLLVEHFGIRRECVDSFRGYVTVVGCPSFLIPAQVDSHYLQIAAANGIFE